MQVHYNLIAAVGPDARSAWLRVRPATTPLTPLQTQLFAAPVELPCPTAYAGPQCTPQQAIADVATRYGVENAFIPTRCCSSCDKTLADYPRAVGAVTAISTSCSRPVRRGDDLRRRRHMHLRGRDIRVELDPGTPRQQMLLHIPAWDFHWQDVYYLVHPIHIGPGDTIRVSCTFDNSRPRAAGVDGKPLSPALRRLGRRHDGRDVPRHARPSRRLALITDRASRARAR